MVVAEVQEGKPLAPAHPPTKAVGGEDSPDMATESAIMVEVNEAWRGELDGGSVSALEMRPLGSSEGAQEGVVVGERGA